MAEKIKRELYSFSIDLEEEVEKEVVKEVEEKNEETGEMETVEKTVTKKSKVKTPVRLYIKKPTRTQIEDGDMFYSIWLNKFIKMGLLTRAMLAKKQVDVGGTLNEDDKINYAKLYLKLFEKQQVVMRYSAKDKDDLTAGEAERLEKSVSELAVIRKELSDFEAAQASIFDHTADVKARNKTITWFLLHLAGYSKGEGEKEGDVEEGMLFPGSEYEEKYRAYQEADENQDPLFTKSIDRLSTIATIWYMSGIQDQDEFETVLDQINDESKITEGDITDVAKEEPKKPAPKVKKKATTKAAPKKTKGSPPKDASDEK
jgi:hypothetical protein